jgi:hypothetical protein
MGLSAMHHLADTPLNQEEFLQRNFSLILGEWRVARTLTCRCCFYAVPACFAHLDCMVTCRDAADVSRVGIEDWARVLFALPLQHTVYIAKSQDQSVHWYYFG